MRKVGTVKSQLEADAFVAGMRKLDMPVVAEKEPNGWDIWAVDEDRISEVRSKLPEFLAAHATEEQLHAFLKQASPDEVKPKATRQSPRPRVKGKRRIPQGLSWIQAAPVTITLIVLCLLVAMVSNFGNNKEVVRALVMGRGGSYDEVLASGQLWRLLTPIFVHFGVMHLLLNIWWLRDLGLMLERALGKWKLVGMVVVIAVFSNLLENVLSAPNSIAGGMSGVVFGLCAYTWVRGRLDLTSGVYVPNQTALFMGIFFFLCWMGLFGAIANITHTAGLLLGLAWGYVDAQRVVHR